MGAECNLLVTLGSTTRATGYQHTNQSCCRGNMLQPRTMSQGIPTLYPGHNLSQYRLRDISR